MLNHGSDDRDDADNNGLAVILRHRHGTRSEYCLLSVEAIRHQTYRCPKLDARINPKKIPNKHLEIRNSVLLLLKRGNRTLSPGDKHECSARWNRLGRKSKVAQARTPADASPVCLSLTNN